MAKDWRFFEEGASILLENKGFTRGVKHTSVVASRNVMVKYPSSSVHATVCTSNSPGVVLALSPVGQVPIRENTVCYWRVGVEEVRIGLHEVLM